VKDARESATGFVLSVAFAAMALVCVLCLVPAAHDLALTAMNDVRHARTSSLSARIPVARDGSLTLEPWAVPAVHRFVEALRPACKTAPFLGVRAAFVSAKDPAATIEAGRIIMLNLFPAVDCAPLPLAVLEKLSSGGDLTALQAVVERLHGVELLLMDGLGQKSLERFLAQQAQTDPQDRLVLLKSIGTHEHILCTPRIIEAAKNGLAPHAELAAILP
jgi:hypothetical protein